MKYNKRHDEKNMKIIISPSKIVRIGTIVSSLMLIVGIAIASISNEPFGLVKNMALFMDIAKASLTIFVGTTSLGIAIRYLGSKFGKKSLPNDKQDKSKDNEN